METSHILFVTCVLLPPFLPLLAQMHTGLSAQSGRFHAGSQFRSYQGRAIWGGRGRRRDRHDDDRDRRRPGPSPISTGPTGGNQACDLNTVENLKKHLPGLFLSENDLLTQANKDLQYTSAVQFQQEQPTRSFSVVAQSVDRVQQQSLSSPRINSMIPGATSQCGCCRTVRSVSIYRTVNIEGYRYDVVNITRNFQFTQVGKCQNEGSPCCGGRCVQMHRYQWMMIWNLTLSIRPPIQFAPALFPSHCECINTFFG